MSSPNYIIIDRDNMKFLTAARDWQQAELIQWCDYPNVATVSFDLMVKRDFSKFSRMELLMMHRNYFGNTGTIWDYAPLIEDLYKKALTIAVDPRSIAELQKLADTLPVKNVKFTPKPETVTAEMMASASKPNPNLATSESRSSPSPQSRPSPKGATGKVWEIADELLKTRIEECNQYPGRTVDVKELRKNVIARCEQAGIHPATAATQWSKWKATKNL